MNNIEVKEKTRVDVNTYGRKEIDRVLEALSEAKRKRAELNFALVMTKEKNLKIKELNHAITIGEKYLASLKKKWGY